MAFGYGSTELGLKNPFKKEGAVSAIRGVIQIIVGIILLFQAVGIVKDDPIIGWILVLFGVSVLGLGIRVFSGGIMATLRYFVGRNPPTSLARNFSKSEGSSAIEEANYVQYKKAELEEMLVGRKNITFIEPDGFMARLLHTFLPKLLYMPYPIRNMTQRIFGAWVNTATAVVAYAFVAFVTLAGFAGETGRLAFPVYSTVLTIYVAMVWFAAGRAILRDAETRISSLGGAELVKVISTAIVMPVVVGLGLSWIVSTSSTSPAEYEAFISALPSLNPLLYLISIIALALICSGMIIIMLRHRIIHSRPLTDVSELRANWQESIHPNEIFINLDNLVMANRRYKEVPNRIYHELDPSLNEQVEGKGAFQGYMIQEVQPKVQEMHLGDSFETMRISTLVSGNVLFVLGIFFTYLLAHAIPDLYAYSRGVDLERLSMTSPEIGVFLGLSMDIVHLVLIGLVINAFARILVNAAHLFYAEMQFESLLVYFKCEGTFTESKISTGTGIYDSTRSENTLVRSSITPWIIVTRIISSTFAATGMRNLEHPRYILEMHKAEADLAAIKHDVISFLKDRESIASITSVRDLDNTSQIHQINQKTRAMADQKNIAHESEAAAHHRQVEQAGHQEEKEE